MKLVYFIEYLVMDVLGIQQEQLYLLIMLIMVAVVMVEVLLLELLTTQMKQMH